MADNTEPKARLQIKQCGELGLWIRIDGEIVDLIHFSDLKSLRCIKESTKKAIEQIYTDYAKERGY